MEEAQGRQDLALVCSFNRKIFQRKKLTLILKVQIDLHGQKLASDGKEGSIKAARS
jgi:hypothetical protein